MSEVIDFHDGGYRYLKSVFQYSAGVAANSGFAIERVRFARPLPLRDGFRAVEEHLRSLGRPTTAFCACELRSPSPFTEQAFEDFNRAYVTTLERWGIYRDGKNPVARTNVCPRHDPPAEPSLHAFSYAVATAGARPSFVIAGGGELRQGAGSYDDRIVRRGDTSPAGLREKMRYVVAEMGRRLAALGFSWAEALSTQAYTVFDIGPLVEEEIFRHGVAASGLTWHFCRPPVINIDYEMDVRAPARESLI